LCPKKCGETVMCRNTLRVLFSQQSALTEHTFSFFAIAMWRIQSAFPLLFLSAYPNNLPVLKATKP
jgi:hypothetical protein